MSYCRWSASNPWYAFPTSHGYKTLLALWHIDKGHAHIANKDCMEVLSGENDIDAFFEEPLTDSEREFALMIIEKHVTRVYHGRLPSRDK